MKRVEHRETHISELFLTGDFVYKIKKPITLDFLDFSTVERRKLNCEREVTLNSRFAPELYIAVVPIYKNAEEYSFNPSGTIVEYAVKMRQFDETQLFSALSERAHLTDDLILQAVDSVVLFHRNAELAPSFWGINDIRREFMANMETCRSLLIAELDQRCIQGVIESFDRLLSQKEELLLRRTTSHVRHLHGDLHFKNICVYQGKPCLFDGIEFNDRLACCDTWADFAFFLMELIFRGNRRQFYLALNRYLERSDDFDGLPLLRLYLCYRATVRAKVALLHGVDQDPLIKAEDLREAQRYLMLSERAMQARSAKLVAIGGLSGTGKSTVAAKLADELGYIHIRTDAVRKHRFGIALEHRAPVEIYSQQNSELIYHEVLTRAKTALEAGWSVIVDGAFLQQQYRMEVLELSKTLQIEFVGLWCEAPRELVIKRLQERQGDISDATVSVLEQQEQIDLGEIDWQRIDTSNGAENVFDSVGHLLRRI